jgi:hypothetical protein
LIVCIDAYYSVSVPVSSNEHHDLTISYPLTTQGVIDAIAAGNFSKFKSLPYVSCFGKFFIICRDNVSCVEEEFSDDNPYFHSTGSSLIVAWRCVVSIYPLGKGIGILSQKPLIGTRTIFSYHSIEDIQELIMRTSGLSITR